MDGRRRYLEGPGDHLGLSAHQRLETLTGDLGRIVLAVRGADLRVLHVRALDPEVADAGAGDPPPVPMSISVRVPWACGAATSGSMSCWPRSERR